MLLLLLLVEYGVTLSILSSKERETSIWDMSVFELVVFLICKSSFEKQLSRAIWRIMALSKFNYTNGFEPYIKVLIDQTLLATS